MAEGQAPRSALGGLSVIEIGTGVAPAFAGRWLAAFGATVFKIEPPEGSPTRHFRPTGEPNGDAASPLSAYLDAGKQSVVLDPRAPEDGARLTEMIASADVVIHDLKPGDLSLVDLDGILARHPELIEVKLTPLGSDGPYRDYAATSLVLLALGGYQYLTGEPGREPLMLPGFQPEYLAAFYGIVAALCGIVARRSGAAGRRFEISMMEALASLHQFTASMWLYEGKVRSRHGNRWEDLYPITTLPCRDGYVAIAMPNPETWERLCGMIERPDLIANARFATTELRRQHADDLDVILAEWLYTRDMAELFTLSQERWRLPLNRYVEIDGVLRDPQYVARGFWICHSADSRAILHPGMPVTMSDTPWRVGPAPKLGDCDDGSLRPRLSPELGGEAHERTNLSAASVGASNRTAAFPLAGLRVLDITRVWSGPLCSRILADLGAQVIRIEPPPSIPSPLSATGDGALQDVRPIAGPGKLNRNKLGVGIDLRVPQGRDLLKRLAARADVLVENFSARVMPKFGLGYETLREVNPGLIYLAMSGYGTTGPYRDYVAYGSTTEAMVGLMALLGYPGEAPRNSAIAYPDAVAGLAGAAAVLTALVHRLRTGRGQFLDLSQLEGATMMLGEFFVASQMYGQMDGQMDGRPPERTGNTHPLWSPHGTYRCRGEDEWVSLAVRSDEEWSVFCGVTGLKMTGGDPEYATADGRRAHRGRLDAAISAWTGQRDKFDVMELFQRAGIPAGAVLNAKELVENSHLASRGFFVQAGSPEGISYPMPGTPIVVNGERRDVWQAAPYLGEDNRRVLKEILDLGDEDIESLVTQGALVGGRVHVDGE